MAINQYIAGGIVGLALALILHMRGQAYAYATKKKKTPTKHKRHIHTAAQRAKHHRALHHPKRGMDEGGKYYPPSQKPQPQYVTRSGGEYIHQGGMIQPGGVINRLKSPYRTHGSEGYQHGDVMHGSSRPLEDSGITRLEPT